MNSPESAVEARGERADGDEKAQDEVPAQAAHEASPPSGYTSTLIAEVTGHDSPNSKQVRLVASLVKDPPLPFLSSRECLT